MAKTAKKTAVITLPLTRSEKEPLFVCLNGKGYLIQRGIPVTVPFGVYKILQRREQALAQALSYEAAAQEKGAAVDRT